MFDTVTDFESAIAEYFGSPYAVATDCCTHALELCLRLTGTRSSSCPRRTYLSVPMTFHKLGIAWQWEDLAWENQYRLGNSNIIDAAVLWQPGSYQPGTLMCLSFQFQKHLSLGRGGMILLDDAEAQQQLAAMSYDGRQRGLGWRQQNVQIWGYHYYMTPETAELGLKKFAEVRDQPPKIWNWRDYPDISKLEVFANVE